MALKRTPFLYRLAARALVFAFVVDPIAISQRTAASVRPAKGPDLPSAPGHSCLVPDPVGSDRFGDLSDSRSAHRAPSSPRPSHRQAAAPRP